MLCVIKCCYCPEFRLSVALRNLDWIRRGQMIFNIWMYFGFFGPVVVTPAVTGSRLQLITQSPHS